ncbi:MAG: DNA polymerase III subunit delta' [Methylococcales bacterium]|nr:DNA polymerase III subunit delta' [Methylococcales bacterium]
MSDIQQSFPWLKASWSQLNRYISLNRVPQALLIVGNKGMGKQQLTSYFSQSLLCHTPLSNGTYCGECQSCLLFDAQTHPDYINIEPEESGKVIGIDIIRQLISSLALKPQYEGYRIVVINPADSLNNASANAFLKYLEEPTERTLIILLTNKPNKLPATIRSRCQKLVIPPVEDNELLKIWSEHNGLSENRKLLLNLSQGAPLLAKQFSESVLLKDRSDSFNQWFKISHSESNLIVTAEQWSKLAIDEARILIMWVISWVVDIIKLSYKSDPSSLYNPDLAISLQEIAVKLDLKSMYQYYDFLLLSQQRLDTQLNKQLIFEEILIQWSKLNGR